MLVPLASNIGAFSDYVAYGLGAVVVLVTVLMWWSSRTAGVTDEEQAHIDAVESGLKHLDHTAQVRTDDPETLVDELRSYVTEPTKAWWRDRARNWLYRRIPPNLVGHAMPITDANGETIHVASVNGRRLAHRDADKLAEDIETVATAIQQREDVPATFSEWYYQDITEGYADLYDSKSRVRGDCKTRLRENMRRNEQLPRDDLVEKFVYEFRYPPDVVEEKLDQLIRRDLRETKDGVIRYQRYG